MHQNIEIALMKTQSRAFRTSDWAEGSPFNRTMNLNTQIKGNSVNVLEWPSHSLVLNPVKYFWRNLKMCIYPIQPDRAWEVRRRMTDNCQILICKACHIIPKKTWGCEGASAKYWVKGMNTYAMYLFQFFLFVINLQSCDNSVFALSIWCMECRCRKKKN